jgi:Zn-dependent protease with chaperone function
VALPEPVAPPPQGLTSSAVVHNNRRRARAIAAVPGVVLFGIIALVLTAVGQSLVGLIAGAAVGAAASLALIFGATSLLLRSLGVRPTDEDDVPRAYNLVEGLCASMGLSPPAICVLDDDARDALALGRGHRTAVLVLTTGLVESLDPVALEGVLAHELTHVRRADIAPATISAALFFPLAVLLPSAGAIVHRLARRGREFHTDQLAVTVTHYPPGLRDGMWQITEGPPPRPASGFAQRAALQTTRWLWTVALPADDSGWAILPDDLVGELDAASVRIAALEEL